MDHEEGIPSGVPADPSVLLEERLARTLGPSPDCGRMGVKLRWRGAALRLVMIGTLSFEQLRPPSRLADTVAGMMWARLADYHQRLGGGETLRVGVEDQDGKILGYVLLHSDARLELFDHADLLLAEWR